MDKPKKLPLVDKLGVYRMAFDIYTGKCKIRGESMPKGICQALSLALREFEYVEDKEGIDVSPYNPYNNDNMKFYWIELWKQRPRGYKVGYFWPTYQHIERYKAFESAIEEVKDKILKQT